MPGCPPGGRTGFGAARGGGGGRGAWDEDRLAQVLANLVGNALQHSITRQLVHGHGGRIEVHSVEGKGTTFTVRLPRQAPAPRTEGTPPASGR